MPSGRSTPVQPDAFADVVSLAVQAAVSPLAERLAVAEAQLARIATAEKAMTELRDRVVTVETKAASPPSADPGLGELRERLLVLETKAAAPVPIIEPRELTIPPAASPEAVAAVRERLIALESKAADGSLADLRDRVTALERRMSDETLTKEIGAIRERIAVVEVRAQLPGPPGADGKDGADGLGFDDLSVDFDGDRTLTLKFERGTLKKTWPITLPYLRYQGVFIDGKTYLEGDVVTWAGSTWTCNEATTTKPGDGSKAWTLCVKKGRDGRDGRDAAGAIPVVKVS